MSHSESRVQGARPISFITARDRWVVAAFLATVFFFTSVVVLLRANQGPTKSPVIDPSRPLQLEATLKAQPAKFVVWSPDSTILATVEAPNASLAPDDGMTHTFKVNLWDPTSATLLSSEAYANISSLAWSPNSKMLAVGLSQATIKVIDRSGRELYTLVSPLPPASAPNAPYPQNWGTISFAGQVSGLSWSPDGRLLATVAYDPYTPDPVSLEGAIHIWNLASSEVDKPFRTIKVPVVQGLDYPGPGPVTQIASWLTSVQWSPDGRTLAAGSPYVIWIWDASTWTLLHVLNGDRAVDSSGNPYLRYIDDSSWSPVVGSQTIAATAGGSIKIWDAPTGQLLRTILGVPQPTPTPTPNPPPTPDPSLPLQACPPWVCDVPVSKDPVNIWAIWWSPDGQKLAAQDLYQTTIWAASTGSRLVTVPASPTYLAWSTDSHMFTTVTLYGDDDGKSTDATLLQVWDATSGDLLKILPPLHPYNFAFSPDGTLFAASTDQGVTLWGSSVPGAASTPVTNPSVVIK